jgi:hypothetical protein
VTPKTLSSVEGHVAALAAEMGFFWLVTLGLNLAASQFFNQLYGWQLIVNVLALLTVYQRNILFFNQSHGESSLLTLFLRARIKISCASIL